MKATQRPRVLVTPSPEVWALLNRVHKASGKPKAAIVSEILTTVAPVFIEMLETMERAAREPDRIRELVSDYGWSSVQTIAQAQLDLKPAPKKRARRASGRVSP